MNPNHAEAFSNLGNLMIDYKDYDAAVKNYEKAYELDSKIFKKENLDICYFITGKKFLNGILHYKLKSVSSQEIYLSEFALQENFVSENKMCEQSNNSVSRLFTRIISKGYQTGKSNEK